MISGKLAKYFLLFIVLAGYFLAIDQLLNPSALGIIADIVVVIPVALASIYKSIDRGGSTAKTANQSPMLKGIKILLLIAFAYFFWLMLKLTLEYVPAKSDISFLQIKQTEVHARPEYLAIFYTHVYTSIFVLFSGFLAINRWHFKIPNFHKIAGKIYVFLILLLAAPSGVYMGIFANGGLFSALSFVILGLLWWVYTFKALRYAIAHNFKKHKQMMWRSFALTLSAITLRFWKVTIVYLFHPNPMDTYQIVAWLGWVLNLAIIEFLILKKII